MRGTYVMNAQDLCMVEHLDDLAAAGVDSLKIEGRNKKAFYVASVVHAYRRVLDGADPAESSCARGAVRRIRQSPRLTACAGAAVSGRMVSAG